MRVVSDIAGVTGHKASKLNAPLTAIPLPLWSFFSSAGYRESIQKKSAMPKPRQVATEVRTSAKCREVLSAAEIEGVVAARDICELPSQFSGKSRLCWVPPIRFRSMENLIQGQQELAAKYAGTGAMAQ
jgi:hypothetical protein